jgi:hypothetical protein
MVSPSCWSLLTPRCIPDTHADGRRPLTWILGITGIAAALPLHATSLTVASTPPSDLGQATVDRAWAYASPLQLPKYSDRP